MTYPYFALTLNLCFSRVCRVMSGPDGRDGQDEKVVLPEAVA